MLCYSSFYPVFLFILGIMPKTLPKRVCDNDAKTASDFLTEIPCLIVKVKFEPKWNSFVLPNVMPNICTIVTFIASL